MQTDLQTPLILLVDDATEYADRLTRSVNRRWSERLQMKRVGSLETYDDGDLSRVVVCLFSHAHTTELQSHCWPDHTRFFLLCDKTDEHRVSRYLPLTEFVSHIAGELADTPPDPVRRARMNMVFSIDRRARDHYVRSEISHALGLGRTVYFLPLMPTYLIPDAELDISGDTLSDLLLAIETGQEVSEKHLGYIYFLHSRGYYQPRLPDRADDLISAQPETLAQLVCLLRAKVEKNGSDHTALIACDSLPLETIGRLAVYCDSLTLVRAGDGMPALIRRELDLLISTLPSSCDVRETVAPA